MKNESLICDITECDVLAISAVVAKQIACMAKDADTLALLGDLVTAVGADLTVMAGQRARREACKALAKDTT